MIFTTKNGDEVEIRSSPKWARIAVDSSSPICKVEVEETRGEENFDTVRVYHRSRFHAGDLRVGPDEGCVLARSILPYARTVIL